MEQIWIPISIFAALMQAVRTAAQKTLNQSMSTMGTTYVRSLFGLPIMLMFLAAVLWFEGGGAPPTTFYFYGNAAAGALVQVLATALLIMLFRLRNFAVGSMLIKADLLMTALIGTLLFSEAITPDGWFALFIVTAGVTLMLVGKIGVSAFTGTGESVASLLFGRATQVALACALMFTLSYLFMREATLALQPGPLLWRAAWTVVVATAIQTVGLGAWLAWKERDQFAKLWPNRRLIAFIGTTSAFGSIGWFIAFAIENASYVRAVGQVEAIFTLAISWLYFKERITLVEALGMALTIAGVLAFRLVS
ncbi:MAG: EamA family transporter [Pseudomonadota bacterium]